MQDTMLHEKLNIASKLHRKKILTRLLQMQ